VINKEKERKKKHYQENKDKYKENAKKWAKKNPEKREVIRKKYRRENGELLNKRDSERYHKNSKEIKMKTMERRKKNPLKHEVQQLTRRKYGSEKKNICLVCKKKGRTDFHHLSYEPNIFVEVCRSCHMDIHSGNIIMGSFNHSHPEEGNVGVSCTASGSDTKTEDNNIKGCGGKIC